MKLYEISNQMQQLQAALEENPDLDLSEVMDSFDGAFSDKVEDTVKFIRSLEADAKAYAEEKKYFAEKEKAAKKQIAGLMSYLDLNMKSNDKDKLKAGVFELSYRKNPLSVEVEDTDKVPKGYKNVKIDVTIDKRKLLKDFKDSHEDIPGVKFIDDKYTLKIK